MNLYIRVLIVALGGVLLGGGQIASAQDRGEFVVDSSALWRRDVHPLDRFDLILTRGFLMTGNSPDSVPIRGGFSGSNYIGASYNIPLFRLKQKEEFFKALYLRLGFGFEFFSDEL